MNAARLSETRVWAGASVLVVLLIAACRVQEAQPTRATTSATLVQGAIEDLSNGQIERAQRRFARDHLWRELGRGGPSIGKQANGAIERSVKLLKKWRFQPSYVGENDGFVLVEGVTRGAYPLRSSSGVMQEHPVGTHTVWLSFVRDGQIVETVSYGGADIFKRQAERPTEFVPAVPEWPKRSTYESGTRVQMDKRKLAQLYAMGAYLLSGRVAGRQSDPDLERRGMESVTLLLLKEFGAEHARRATERVRPLKILLREVTPVGTAVFARLEAHGKVARRMQALGPGASLDAQGLLVAHQGTASADLESARLYLDADALLRAGP